MEPEDTNKYSLRLTAARQSLKAMDRQNLTNYIWLRQSKLQQTIGLEEDKKSCQNNTEPPVKVEPDSHGTCSKVLQQPNKITILKDISKVKLKNNDSKAMENSVIEDNQTYGIVKSSIKKKTKLRNSLILSEKLISESKTENKRFLRSTVKQINCEQQKSVKGNTNLFLLKKTNPRLPKKQKHEIKKELRRSNRLSLLMKSNRNTRGKNERNVWKHQVIYRDKVPKKHLPVKQKVKKLRNQNSMSSSKKHIKVKKEKISKGIKTEINKATVHLVQKPITAVDLTLSKVQKLQRIKIERESKPSKKLVLTKIKTNNRRVVKKQKNVSKCKKLKKHQNSTNFKTKNLKSFCSKQKEKKVKALPKIKVECINSSYDVSKCSRSTQTCFSFILDVPKVEAETQTDFVSVLCCTSVDEGLNKCCKERHNTKKDSHPESCTYHDYTETKSVQNSSILLNETCEHQETIPPQKPDSKETVSEANSISEKTEIINEDFEFKKHFHTNICLQHLEKDVIGHNALPCEGKSEINTLSIKKAQSFYCSQQPMEISDVRSIKKGDSEKNNNIELIGSCAEQHQITCDTEIRQDCRISQELLELSDTSNVKEIGECNQELLENEQITCEQHQPSETPSAEHHFSAEKKYIKIEHQDILQEFESNDEERQNITEQYMPNSETEYKQKKPECQRETSASVICTETTHGVNESKNKCSSKCWNSVKQMETIDSATTSQHYSTENVNVDVQQEEQSIKITNAYSLNEQDFTTHYANDTNTLGQSCYETVQLIPPAEPWVQQSATLANGYMFTQYVRQPYANCYIGNLQQAMAALATNISQAPLQQITPQVLIYDPYIPNQSLTNCRSSVEITELPSTSANINERSTERIDIKCQNVSPSLNNNDSNTIYSETKGCFTSSVCKMKKETLASEIPSPFEDRQNKFEINTMANKTNTAAEPIIVSKPLYKKTKRLKSFRQMYSFGDQYTNVQINNEKKQKNVNYGSAKNQTTSFSKGFKAVHQHGSCSAETLEKEKQPIYIDDEKRKLCKGQCSDLRWKLNSGHPKEEEIELVTIEEDK